MKRVRMMAATAIAFITACSTYNPPEYAEAKILAPVPNAGTGTVRNVSVVPFPERTYHLFIVMDDGATRTVEVTNPTFLPDERVEITADGRLVRLSGSTFKG